MPSRGVPRLLAAQHSCHLVDSLVSLDVASARCGDRLMTVFTDHALGDHDLSVGQRRDLGEVGNDHHLMSSPEARQRLGDRSRRRSTNPGIDLVEDERLRCFGKNEAQCKHGASQLATTCNSGEWKQRQARVGRDQEGDVVARRLAANGDLHLCVRHRQGTHDVANSGGQCRRAGPSHGRNG